MFSFPLFSASKSQARSGSARSGSSAEGTNRVWEVDLRRSEGIPKECPVLRWLGSEIAGRAYQHEATFFFEPWVKYGGQVFVQDKEGLDEVFPLPETLFLDVRRLVLRICGICARGETPSLSGQGRLVVSGQPFALTAVRVPSPWGERLLLSAKHTGDPISDPVSLFPWITLFGFPRLVFSDTEIDFSQPAIWDGRYVSFVARLRERAGDFSRWMDRKLRRLPQPSPAQRLELLNSNCFDERNAFLFFLCRELRTHTSHGTSHTHLLADNKVAQFYYETVVESADGRAKAWRPNDGYYSSLARSARQIRQALADLAWRYPTDVVRSDGAVGIACEVGGHPLDVTVTESRADAVPWCEQPVEFETVFSITIHEASPDPPHWERNRRLREEQRASGEEDPPSSEYGSMFFYGPGDHPPRRSLYGWIRSRVGGMGRAQAGDMTREDAREVASLLKARHYEKALSQALPFKSGGPEVEMDIVPPCLVGLLELLLGRYEEARASIGDYQMHAGEDLVSILLLAECCKRLGDTGGEQEAMRRALELSSKPVARLVANGELLEDHGFMKQAEFLYELSLEKEATEKYDRMAQENERKYRSCERRAHQRRLAWRYAQLLAEHAVAADGIDTYLMPTEYGFAHEKKTREHGGLYWQDIEQPDGRRIRQYFPNYLNRFADNFRADPTAVRKLGPVLKQMGRADEAAVFLFEALLGL